MNVGHEVHTVCHTHQAHDPKPQTSYTLCPTAPANTLPVDTTAQLETQHVKVVGKKVTGEQNATALAPLVCKCPTVSPGSRVAKRGENHKLPKPKQRKDSCTKTCLLLQWTAEQ